MFNLKYKNLIFFNVFILLIFIILSTESFPSPTSASTTHVVSFVKHKRVKQRHDERPDFDLESFIGNPDSSSNTMKHASLVQQFDTDNPDNDIDSTASTETEANPTKATDDATNQMQNTLENSMDFSENEIQHESPTSSSMHLNASDPLFNRVKQSIPVLEPVKHLLNTVRGGSLDNVNDSSSSTPHHSSHSRHHLVSPNENFNQTAEHHDSAAIETEEDREMVNDSTGFEFLEILGRIGGMIWSFFLNIQKLFAASSGNLSAATASASSGSK